MPLMLEWVTQPCEQDEIDLNKMLSEGLDTTQSTTDWLRSKQNDGIRIAGGRFNDRLICLALLLPQSDRESGLSSTTYAIDNVWVRAITRQRGVAKQLLVRLCQWADHESITLTVSDDEHQWRTLLEFGFLYEKGCWTRPR